MERTARKKLTQECDLLWSQIIRSKNKCQLCGKTEGLQAAHIFSRTNKNTRWDVQNGLCLCLRCHLYFAHKEPMLFAEKVKEMLGQKVYRELRQRAQISAKGQDLQAIKIFLEQELKKYE
jgi:predicted restriction endonuclease